MSWVAIALSIDLERGMAMPARLNGTDLAVWRSNSGQAFVWGDRCPHRGMRLSHGFVRGEELACIYHGWQYGADGGCVAIPAHPDLVPPKSICATTYPVREHDGLIWTSLSDTSVAVPRIAASEPVRSITVEADLDAVAAQFGVTETQINTLEKPHAITLALHPVEDARTAVHALTTEPKNRRDVSRWLEAQRADIESVMA